MRRALVALAALFAVLAAACGQADEQPQPEAGQEPEAQTPAEEQANSLQVKMREYAFEVSGDAAAGPLTLNFTNEGESVHHAITGRLDEGKTLEDVRQEIMKGGEGPPPPWFHDEPADMSVISPGESAGLTIDASQEGTYVLLCFIPGPQRKPHAALGMMQTFEVTGMADAEDPTPQASFSLTRDAVTTSDLAEGSAIVEVTNNAKQPADFHVVRLEEGKSLEDLDPWFEQGMKGPAPATFFGGTHEIRPGKSALLSLSLQPGTYTAVATYQGKTKKDVTEQFAVE